MKFADCDVAPSFSIALLVVLYIFGSCGGLAEVARLYGQHGRPYSILQTQDEIDSTSAAQVLQGECAPLVQRGSYVSRGVGRASMVVSQTQSVNRDAFSVSRTSSCVGHGCVFDRLGGSRRLQSGSGSLDSQGVIGTHQCFGDVGSRKGSVSTVSVGSRKESVGEVGQLDGSCIHQQTGRNQVLQSLSACPENSALVLESQHLSSGYSHSRDRECTRGQSLQMGTYLSDRVDVVKAGFPVSAISEGVSDDRLVCVPVQSSASGVLFSGPGRGCVRIRRHVNRLVRHGGLRISSDIPSIEGSIEDSSGGLSGGIGSADVAETAMVFRASAVISGLSNQSPAGAGHVEDAGVSGEIPRCASPEINCMDIIQQQYEEAGFSREVAGLVARGRRKSTLKVYSSRVRQFLLWCELHQVCSNTASVPEVADFLKSRFDKGLQASTVRGYLSAIQSIHQGCEDGSSLASSKPLKLLIEGMSNERPRLRNIWPSWDLPLVLEFLSKSPFEPIQSATLRDSALKTLFLIAIASGRRCSELHALAIGDFMVFSRDGVTMYFRPGFLAKNERSNFSATPLFLPVLSKSKDRRKRLNCPVRALRWYLDKTKTLRGDIQQLFVTSQKPHKATAKTTLAGWLVDVIAKSGAVKSAKLPRAHSVRGYSATWAFKRGLSIKEVMNTVSWKSDSTFTKTYLKDIGPRLDHGRYAMAVLSASNKSSK